MRKGATTMGTDPLRQSQRMVPYLYVDDVAAYLEFLSRAFGFDSRVHQVEPLDPEHVHEQAALGDTRDPEGNQWYFATPGPAGCAEPGP
jgi:uncharacterized glyoxalase superfamily protein PhnB